MVIFLTDGAGYFDEVASYFNEKDFVAVRRGLKSFDCFCVGYSKHFVRSALDDIAKAANMGKTEKHAAGKRIEYVHEADSGNLVKTIMEIGNTVNLYTADLKAQRETCEEERDYLTQ